MRNHTGQGRAGQEAGSPDRLATPGTRRRWLQAGGLLLLGGGVAPWLAGCQPVPAAPLMLGLNAWVGYDPLVLARERGLIDPRAVKVIELSSSSETLRHFRNRLLDAAALTLDEALRLADEGFDPRVVAVLSASAGADVVMALPEVRNLAGLRGRTVAVEATTVGALMLQRLLQAAGLQPDDVKVLNVEATEHLALLRADRAQVSVSYEPLAGALREAGLVPIFDSRQTPGDIVDVLLVHADALQTRPEQVQALVAGWQRGLAAVQQAPEASAAVLAPGADLTPEQYLASFKGLDFYNAEQSLAWLSGQPKALGQASQGLAITLQTMGLIHETPDWGRLLAPEPAERVRQTPGAGA
ncbi:MAG: ABC transporter substrate-binding protein [Hydrogenophaga sp.]|uniref:ABC transporter substrate-binding protein n=1 Tax=Hydrogenophaga sp. TaxID=1904254 RepID=UPI003D9B77EB